jgi:hypothetical protein
MADLLNPFFFFKNTFEFICLINYSIHNLFLSAYITRDVSVLSIIDFDLQCYF